MDPGTYSRVLQIQRGSGTAGKQEQVVGRFQWSVVLAGARVLVWLFGYWLVVFVCLFFLSSTQLLSVIIKVLPSFPMSLQVRKLSQRFRDQKGVRAGYRLLALQPCVVIGAWIF